MSTVAANFIDGHDGAEDDTEHAEDEEGEGEGDLLDGGLVVDAVRGFHHDVLVGNRERVVHICHCRFLQIYSCFFKMFLFCFFSKLKIRLEETGKERKRRRY